MNRKKKKFSFSFAAAAATAASPTDNSQWIFHYSLPVVYGPNGDCMECFSGQVSKQKKATITLETYREING